MVMRVYWGSTVLVMGLLMAGSFNVVVFSCKHPHTLTLEHLFSQRYKIQSLFCGPEYSCSERRLTSFISTNRIQDRQSVSESVTRTGMDFEIQPIKKTGLIYTNTKLTLLDR